MCNIRKKIASGLVDYVKYNFPYDANQSENGSIPLVNTNWTEVIGDAVSIWYKNTPVAIIVLTNDSIYFGYGARYWHHWPFMMKLDYADPNTIDIIHEKLSTITL